MKMVYIEDGTIQKVNPTLRGVGLTNASRKIEIDRYSLINGKGASTSFLDSLYNFGGRKTILNSRDAWIQYNSVDFGKNNMFQIVRKLNYQFHIVPSSRRFTGRKAR
jgi:hypothetical protein